jgi:uracil phosphoribosyltransferase
MIVELNNSPIISQLIGKIRDKKTEPPEFRRSLFKLGRFIAYEAAKYLSVSEKEVETPLDMAKYIKINEDIVVIAILRAALPMSDGVLDVFQDASLGIVSASRGKMLDEKGEKFEINVSYTNIPNLESKTVFIVDPMLASASTILKILALIKNQKPTQIFLLSAISARFGVEQIKSLNFVHHISAAIDEELNSKGYIVPGLGDAGDRAFST